MIRVLDGRAEGLLESVQKIVGDVAEQEGEVGSTEGGEEPEPGVGELLDSRRVYPAIRA